MPELVRSRSTNAAGGGETRPLRLVVLVVMAMALAGSPVDLCAQAVRGSVVDDLTGEPLRGVVVALEDSTGRVLVRAITPASGAFVFETRESGTFSLQATRLGYLPLRGATVRTRAGQVLDVEVRLRPEPVRIRSVRVRAEARDPGLESMGFYQRREMGIGGFITAEEIRDATPQRVSDVLSRDPSVRILRDFGGDGGIGAVVNFRGRLQGLEGRPCLPTLVLDGSILRRGGGVGAGSPAERVVRLDEMITPEEIAAVELYPSGAGAPARFSGTDARCGVILVWRKRRP